MWKIVVSNLVSGCSFWEYYNLRFYKRNLKNQNTFLTTYYNSVFFHRHNSCSDQKYLYNKARFNELFGEFRGINWCDLDGDLQETKEFLKRPRRIIVKPKRGECGHGVFTIDTSTLMEQEMERWIADHKNMVCEDVISNHPDVARLNESSLNTVRIITYLSSDNQCHIIWTGIRIGRKGACVDNISEGGSCCAIAPESGRITSPPMNEHGDIIEIGVPDTVGYQLPLWSETLAFVDRVSKVLPSMRFVAWDIAITPEGPVLIEGNHCVSNTISQVHIPLESEGLRKRLEECTY